MDLSVIVPLYNEVENVAELDRDITGALAEWGGEYEVIYVDDGSSDGTFASLEELAAANSSRRVVKLSRNFGQTAALAAGIAQSRGRDVALLDGDRQNDPADIPRMVEKRAEGFDLVAGWRSDRRDDWWSRRLPSMIANWLIGRATGVRLHDYGCTLKVLDGELARSLRLYGEMHRFIPVLVDDQGGRIFEIKVNHRPRLAGVSKYGISRTVRVVLDLATVRFLSSYATRPIHVFGLFGLVATFFGLVTLGWLGFERIYLDRPIGDRPLVLLGILLTIMGMQFVTMGLLGEILVRTYHESQGKPVYRIERIL